MKHLDPKVIWLFFINMTLKWLILIFVFGGYSILALHDIYKGGFSFNFLKWLWLIIPALLIFIFVWAKLAYRFYYYELTNNGFRKECGVIWKKYVTIPYDRIQNVDIYRGVIARILGLSDLHIQTAGMSAQGSRYGVAEGRLPGLSREVAEQLRDELILRANQSKNQGL